MAEIVVRNPRERDFWLAPVVIDSTNNGFVVDETGAGGAGVVSVTLEAGTYWPYKTTRGSYTSLWSALETKLAASAANYTYTVSASTPTLSSDQVNGGLTIGGAADAWSIRFDHASFSMDPRLFGFADGRDTSFSATFGGATYDARSPYSCFSVWRSETRGGDGIASIKRAFPYIRKRDSHDRPQDRFTLVWDSQTAVEWLYEDVESAHVLEDDGAGLLDAAGVARLAQNDNNNTFEAIWLAFMRNQIVLCVYDVDDDDYDLTLTTGATDAAALVRRGDWGDTIFDILRRRRVASESYDIAFDTWYLETVAG